MKASEYKALDKSETWMWWYRALHRNLLLLIQRHACSLSPVILDAGCGTGGFLSHLSDKFTNSTIVGLDLSEMAYRRAKEKTGGIILCANVNALPFRSNHFDVIVSADVICHESVDETMALQEISRCLKIGGIFLLNLPAYNWMRAGHDLQVCTARRYTISRVKQALDRARLEVVVATHWNMLLFPVMMIRRKFMPLPSGQSEVLSIGMALNTIFDRLCQLEYLLIKKGLRLPFGGSVLVLAVKR